MPPASKLPLNGTWMAADEGIGKATDVLGAVGPSDLSQPMAKAATMSVTEGIVEGMVPSNEEGATTLGGRTGGSKRSSLALDSLGTAY